MNPRPSPANEIRLLLNRPIHGPNFWSARPVTRLDLAVGAYDEISSADMPGFTDALITALPGLLEHRCCVGERGGFVERLRRGTYAPHIVEHVGLELQSAIGHDTGFGRARGGDRPGEYTVVFEHRHPAVGARAGILAVELVQDAFAGLLGTAEYAIAELAAIATGPEAVVRRTEVACGITGGSGRSAVRWEMHRQRIPRHEPIVEVPPSEILEAGLPYTRSRIAVILDARPRDVPWRYREPDRARQLVSVLAEGVASNGIVIIPDDDEALAETVRQANRRIAVFSRTGRTPPEADVCATAGVRGDYIVVESPEGTFDAGTLSSDSPVAAQIAGALAATLLRTARSAAPKEQHEREITTAPGASASTSAEG